MHAQDLDDAADEIKSDDTLANIATDGKRWTKVSVGLLEHPGLDIGPYDRRSAWLWLIQNAAWKAHRVRSQGRLLTLHRGQVLIARKHLAETWRWSEKKVRTFLEFLLREGMVSTGPDKGRASHGKRAGTDKGQAPNVVTICKYEFYQGADFAEGQRRASEGPAKGQTVNKDRKGREDDDLSAHAREAEIIQLDERRPNPFGVREDQFIRYHALASIWGYRSGAIVVTAPLERALSDSNLLSGLAPYENRPRDLVLLSVDLALAESEARRADAHRLGSDKGPVGLGPCANYFSKVLSTTIEAQLMRVARLEAAARAEMAVQEAKLSRRMSGISPSGWGDLAARELGEVNHG